MFLPLGCFSLLGGATLLLTFPIMIQNIAAWGNDPISTYFHYTTFLTPFVFVSAIYGLRNYINWAKTQEKISADFLIRFAIYWILSLSLVMSDGSEYRKIANYLTKDNSHFDYVRKYLKNIPPSESVRTHEFFAPHLAMRKELHIYENHHPKEGGSERAKNTTLVVLDEHFLGEFSMHKLKEIKDNGYHLIHHHKGFYVFKNNKV